MGYLRTTEDGTILGRLGEYYSPPVAGGLGWFGQAAHVCRPGEGPPAAVPDPEGKGPHPLVYRGVTPKRSRNPTVGDAQILLNRFLQQLNQGTFRCQPGADMAQIQSLRRLLSTDPLVVDCRFGPDTEKATLMFQRCVFPGSRTEWDGKIGPKTWRELIKLRPVPHPPPSPPPPPPVRPVCPPLTCAPVLGSFLPSAQGFRFPNSFTLTIPLPGPFPPISGSFGLCGGMSTAALDYFLSCIPIPSTAVIPTRGTTLFSYLLARQLDSLGSPTFGLVAKFLEWTNRPDTKTVIIDGLQELTLPEFLATLASVRTGRPVVIGLVNVGPGAVSIWENHQVLAYGSVPVRAGVTDIRICDPNDPRDDRVVIRCETLAGGARVRCTQHWFARGITKNVRGFFRMPYVRKTPPCLP